MYAQAHSIDLVDEYRLMVHPIVLGQGLPLFGAARGELPLRLLDARRFSSGVVLLRYARDRGEAPGGPPSFSCVRAEVSALP